MHRVAGEDLRNLVYVAIRTAPKLVLGGLRAKLPQDGDRAAGELADRICAGIDNDSYMVLRTEMKGGGTHQSLGKWGVDEPDPTARNGKR